MEHGAPSPGARSVRGSYKVEYSFQGPERPSNDGISQLSNITSHRLLPRQRPKLLHSFSGHTLVVYLMLLTSTSCFSMLPYANTIYLLLSPLNDQYLLFTQAQYPPIRHPSNLFDENTVISFIAFHPQSPC